MFTAASAVSLLLCLATVLAWVESYHYSFTFDRRSVQSWNWTTAAGTSASSGQKKWPRSTWNQYELRVLPGFVFLCRRVFDDTPWRDVDKQILRNPVDLQIISSLLSPDEVRNHRRRATDGSVFRVIYPWRGPSFDRGDDLPDYSSVVGGPFGVVFARLLVGADREYHGMNGRDYEVPQGLVVPFSVFIVLFAALPILWTLSAVRRHRARVRSDRGRKGHRTIRRHVFTLASAVSLLLCAATLFAWFESYRYWVTLRQHIFQTASGKLLRLANPGEPLLSKVTIYDAHISPGFVFIRRDVVQGQPPLQIYVDEETTGLDVQFSRMRPDDLPAYRKDAADGADFQPRRPLRFAGFGFASFRDPAWNSNRMHQIRQEFLAPFWPFAAIFAILPAVWIAIAIRRRRRITGNLCATCGYNLTANISGICPECGIASQQAEAMHKITEF